MSHAIHFLNTGHSDCILLESDGHFALIDAGEDTDFPADKPHLRYPGYEKEVCEYLQTHCADKNGQITLDFVLGTHCHSDHLGGFDTVINLPNLTVKQAFLKPYHEENIFIMERRRWDNREVYTQMKEALERKNVPITESFDRLTLTLGAFKITFFNGTYQKPKCKFGENVHSVVTLVEYGKFKTVLAGDMNYKNGGEKAIAKLVGKVDVLKVGHHGYSGSSSVHWLRTLHPDYAVFCNNRRRVHPHVLFRIRRITKAKTYFTADCGGVKAVFSEDKITWQTDIMPSA